MNQHLLFRGYLRLWSHYRRSQTETHPLTYLFWESTLNCNFACKHCGSNAGAGRSRVKGELTSVEIKKTLKEISQDFDPRKIILAVTGGEPLVRKDLFEVTGYASKLGFPWGMVTNGYLMDQKTVVKAKEAGMKTVVVSIDGIGKTHDWFRGVEGAYDRAVAAVKSLARENFLDDLQITTVIYRRNFSELEKMYKTFLTLGINSWRLFNVDPIGRAENNQELLLNSKQLKGLLDFITEKRKQSRKVEITYGCGCFLGLDYEKKVRGHFFTCPTGINVASILANGDIYVCPNVPRRTELVQGNVRKDRFSEVWNDKFKPFRDPNRTKCRECQNCEFWEDCAGGSFHLWDFEMKRPKMCIYKEMAALG
jgi:radical SAM protein with 4Fe4S-binding SPASM domain